MSKTTKYKLGDIVECPPSGPYPGNRIGQIIRITQLPSGEYSRQVLVRYIDHPDDNDAWVRPIRKTSKMKEFPGKTPDL